MSAQERPTAPEGGRQIEQQRGRDVAPGSLLNSGGGQPPAPISAASVHHSSGDLWFPIVDELLHRPDIPAKVKAIFAAHQPGRLWVMPTREDIRDVLPWAWPKTVSQARRLIEKHDLAVFDRTGRGDEEPLAFKSVADWCDPYVARNKENLSSVTENISTRVKGKLAAEKWVICAEFHTQQHRRGAVQLRLEEISWLLGIPVRTTRSILTSLQQAGVIELHRKHHKGAAPVYLLPGGIREPDPDEFEPDKTPSFVKFGSLLVYTSPRREDVVRKRLQNATSEMLQAVSRMVAAAERRWPELPAIHADDLLNSGPLSVPYEDDPAEAEIWHYRVQHRAVWEAGRPLEGDTFKAAPRPKPKSWVTDTPPGVEPWVTDTPPLLVTDTPPTEKYLVVPERPITQAADAAGGKRRYEDLTPYEQTLYRNYLDQQSKGQERDDDDAVE